MSATCGKLATERLGLTRATDGRYGGTYIETDPSAGSTFLSPFNFEPLCTSIRDGPWLAALHDESLQGGNCCVRIAAVRNDAKKCLYTVTSEIDSYVAAVPALEVTNVRVLGE